MAKKKTGTDAPSVDRKAIAIISTDWHLKASNKEQLKDLIKQQCELAVKLDVKTMFVAGDVLDSRPGQKVEILVALEELLEIIHSYELELWVIPGNHDKQNYDSDDSFLNSFRYFPKVHYIHKAADVPFGDITFHLLPFYKEDVWLERFNALKKYIFTPDSASNQKHILISHTAINGSRNNDGSEVSCGISASDFKEFHTVLLGHYHDMQQVGVNVFHMPSIQQNNFGENNRKGFTVVFDDGSFELVKSEFKEYEKISIDCDTISKEDLAKLVKKSAKSPNYVRFEFHGSSSVVKSINKEELNALGIDVKIKVKEVEDSIVYAQEEIRQYNAQNIVEEFEIFCAEKGIDFAVGVEYLNKKLQNG